MEEEDPPKKERLWESDIIYWMKRTLDLNTFMANIAGLSAPIVLFNSISYFETLRAI